MRSAADWVSAVLATAFVLLAVVFATGVGVTQATPGPTQEPVRQQAAHQH